MSNLAILQRYARTSPEALPASILFKHSARNLVIFDAFPKAIFHFLILPRIQEPRLNADVLTDLRTLVSGDKELAKEVITSLEEEAKEVKKEIEDEMVDRYGFKWDVWTGFHGAPSMVHLHLHVISADLCSDKLKTKKHYNSFHPKLGFFMHMEEVLSWFEADPTFFSARVKQLKPSKSEPLLKEKLFCFHCEAEMKNMPSLKAHLQEEWNKLEKRRKESAKRKRKLDELRQAASQSVTSDDSQGDSSTSSKKAKS